MLSPTDTPLTPSISDSGDIWAISGTATIPAALNSSAGVAINATNNAALAAAGFDVIYYSMKCSIGPTVIQNGMARGQGVLGATSLNQVRQTQTGIPTGSANWKASFLTGGNFFGGAGGAQQIQEGQTNWPANTIFEHPLTKPSLSLAPPFGIGDGVILSFFNTAATGGVCDFTVMVRIRGLGAGA